MRDQGMTSNFGGLIGVEVLCYIPQGLIRVLEVPVTKIRFWELKWKVLWQRWWWILNRSKHIIIWCCRCFLQLSSVCIGMVFHALVWWFSMFRIVFHAVFHASFRVQECWQVSAAHIVPLSFVLVEFQIRCCKDKGETILVQVCYHRYTQGYW